MDLNKIGRFIFKLRKEKNLSQNGLAELIPVTRQAVSSWELGKSLPDSQTLMILGDIFSVSINELLAGEKLTNDKEETKEKIALSLVDEINIKKRIIISRTIVFIITILAILSIFLGYYFINSYNSIKVFKVQGKNENFKTYNGIIISTKQKIYIRLGELININKDNKISNLRLYFKDKNNHEKVLYQDSKTDILITSNYGYDGGFTNDELKYLVDNLYLEINYGDKTNKLKLTVKKDFSNNLSFYNKEESILENNNLKSTSPIIYDNIKINMEKKGIKEDKSYKLVITNEDENININLTDRNLLLEVMINNIKETWKCYLSNNTSVSYSKFENGNEKIHTRMSIDNNTELNNEEEEIYNKLTSYINKYIINSN